MEAREATIVLRSPKRYHLKAVSGRIPIPDLRIEYVNENDNEIQRRDLELATEHYRPRGLSAKSAALRASEPLRTNPSAGNPAVPVTVRQLVKHYTNNELPGKAHSTQRTVETSLNVWMVPQWGDFRLSDVRTVVVENWPRGLSLANATKAKIRNVMHSIFAHACRHEWLMRNPISLVRQSAKRTKVPDVLDAEDLRKLLTELQNPALAGAS